MKEELYIIDNGRLEVLDLQSPSGISLKFQSNLFSDLSKITCSHSYTFILPYTKRNIQTLDMMEESRRNSKWARKKILAEYRLNGIPLFTDGNLYVTEITPEGYNCTLTWEVCSGLQKVFDDDITIDKLPVASELHTLHNAMLPSNATNVVNTSGIFAQPRYISGVSVHSGRRDDNVMYYNGVPCVMAKHIINAIAQKYGLTIQLGKELLNAGVNADSDYLLTEREITLGISSYGKDFPITFGAIPLATRNITEEQASEDYAMINYDATSGYKTMGINNVIPLHGTTTGEIEFGDNNWSFAKAFLQTGTNEYNASYISGTWINGYQPLGISFLMPHEGIILNGRIDVRLSSPTDALTLKIYAWGIAEDEDNKGKVKAQVWEVQTLEGVADSSTSSGSRQWAFIFDESLGYSNIEIERYSSVSEEIAPSGIFFALDKAFASADNNFKMSPKLTDRQTGDYVDMISNLPSVSCKDFIEFCFRSIGAFPVARGNTLKPIYYTDIQDNLRNGNCLDWSNKMIGSISDRPDSIVLSMNDYAQKNYFLMASDDTSKSEADRQSESDVYAHGEGFINIKDDNLAKKADTYKAPFNSYIEKYKSAPKMNTGKNIKAWEYSVQDRTASRCDVEPTFGIILHDNTNNCATFKVFNPFRVNDGVMGDNPSFAFMQDILEKPFIIKENFNLNEIDLMNIDYSKPVYLDKYNAFFAVITIDYSVKNGVSTVELIKIK